MCGRYALSTPIDVVAAVLGADLDGASGAGLFGPRYNIAPTQQAPVVRVVDGRRVLGLLHWGLVPSWAKDRSIGNRMINARSESVAEKPAFRAALRRRRCLVPADGFYEWQRLGEGTRAPKQPWFIHAAGDGLLAMAGLWERWKEPGGETLDSFTILTTEANALMRPLHDRMPVLLAPEAYERWLDPAQQESADATALLVPAPEKVLAAHKVSTHVNSPRNDDSACCAREG
ncbi:MAG: SOS response-associated peptidase [Phycisphaerales bacterium]|nr:SOS response-associated peptidase [Phycisphaerales bacterium]